MSAEGVMASNSEVTKGEHARMSSFVGAIAVADLVKTTLGPKGMDKILQSVSDPNNMKITITNDGATILKSVPVDNPAAKVLVEIAKTQDDTVGDGTTSVAVLCGELLREAEFLVQQRVHPMTIVAGWRTAVQVGGWWLVVGGWWLVVVTGYRHLSLRLRLWLWLWMRL